MSSAGITTHDALFQARLGLDGLTETVCEICSAPLANRLGDAPLFLNLLLEDAQSVGQLECKQVLFAPQRRGGTAHGAGHRNDALRFAETTRRIAGIAHDKTLFLQFHTSQLAQIPAGNLVIERGELVWGKRHATIDPFLQEHGLRSGIEVTNIVEFLWTQARFPGGKQLSVPFAERVRDNAHEQGIQRIDSLRKIEVVFLFGVYSFVERARVPFFPYRSGDPRRCTGSRYRDFELRLRSALGDVGLRRKGTS